MSSATTGRFSKRGASRSPSVTVSPKKSKRSHSFDVRRVGGYAKENAFAVHLLAGLLAFIVIYFIYRNNHREVNAWASIPSSVSNSFVLGLIVLAAVVLAAWATSFAHRHSSRQFLGMSVVGLYYIALLLLVVITWLVYRGHNFTTAFLFSLLLLVGVVAHFSLVWRMSHGTSLAVVPLLLFCLAVTYYLSYMADASTECKDACRTVRAAKYSSTPINTP